MQYNEDFRKVGKEKLKVDIRENNLPDQTYINRLIASLDSVEANSYSQSQASFISEYKYLEAVGALQSIEEFVDGCLNQLLWIKTILESGKLAKTEAEFEEEFGYETPIMLGDSWTLNKVTKKGVFFRGAEPYQDSRVIINSENIFEISIALSTVVEKYNKHVAANKNEQGKNRIVPSSKVKETSLFISKELENNCLNVLKEIKKPVIDINGQFINKHGMKGAIVIWYYKCESLSFTNKTPRNRDEVAKVVMELIPNLKIDGSSFDKNPAAKKYKAEIEQKLSNLSL